MRRVKKESEHDILVTDWFSAVEPCSRSQEILDVLDACRDPDQPWRCRGTARDAARGVRIVEGGNQSLHAAQASASASAEPLSSRRALERTQLARHHAANPRSVAASGLRGSGSPDSRHGTWVGESRNRRAKTVELCCRIRRRQGLVRAHRQESNGPGIATGRICTNRSHDVLVAHGDDAAATR